MLPSTKVKYKKSLQTDLENNPKSIDRSAASCSDTTDFQHLFFSLTYSFLTLVNRTSFGSSASPPFERRNQIQLYLK